jgi:CHAT domain
MPFEEKVMSNTSVFNFNITVDANGTIQSTQTGNPDIRGCQLKINFQEDNDLRRETIEFLIDNLRKGCLVYSGYRLLGEYLYSVLLDNEIGEAINQVLFKKPGTELVRVQLEFTHNVQGVDLSSWPWEYLYCPPKYGSNSGYFLAKTPRLVMARRLNLRQFPPLTVERDELPVRLLFVAANPDDQDPVIYESVLNALEELETESDSKLLKVYQLVDKHQKNSLLEDASPLTTFQGFLEAVEVIEPHVVHFIGHGRNTDAGGEIAFMGEDRQAVWVKDSTLAQQLMMVSRELRLVFLQSCESALPSNSYQAISGCAQLLAHNAIPAVVGMQYKVQLSAGNVFAKTFYEELAHSQPIDVAVQRGRREMQRQLPDWQESHVFGLPVLYLSNSQDRDIDSMLIPLPKRAKTDRIETCPTVDRRGRYRRERRSLS